MGKNNRSLPGLCALVCAAAFLLLTVPGFAQPQALMTRHVREAVQTGQAQAVGHLPPTQTLRFDVVLALRHSVELDNFLDAVADRTNPLYRKFVTVPEFTARFGPSQEDYDALIRFAEANGFKVMGGSRDAMDVQLKGSVAAIEKAFHVSLNVYQHPTENRTFFAPDREPTVNLPFQLWHVSGLDNYSIPHSNLLRKTGGGVEPNTVKGSCPQNAYCGSDMRAAYYGQSALTGVGQTVGLLEYLGFDIADVDTYYTNAHQTLTIPVVGISTDGSDITCLASQGCDDTEQTLDITQAASMAPGLNQINIYVGGTDTAMLSSMSTNSPLDGQIGSSWTWQPSDPTQADPYFKKFAAQGQNFFQAAGDSGAYTSGSQYVFPADDPYVTVVGGTDLQTQSAGGPWLSETAWVDGGGGIYTPDSFPIPAWQQLPGVITAANEGSTTVRNSPDVSAESNFDFYVCADQSGCTANEYGGTSFAAPMWAGYMALVNQQAAANGLPSIGFVNPAIYELGIGSGYTTEFHDITSGSNGEPTTTGYDLSTGWGSPNGAALINALAGPQQPGFILSLSPNTLKVVEGSNGTSTLTVTDLGGFSGTVKLSASGLPSGVTAAFNPTSTTTTSTLTLTATATAAVGTTTVTVTGVSGSITETTTLSLTVAGPDFSLTATPNKVNVPPGTSGTSSIAIVPINGFTGSVTMAASNLPTGVTASFSPNPTTSSSTVTFTASASAAAGVKTVTITGTSGSLTHTTTVSVTVKGAKVKLTPTSLTFGTFAVGTTASSKTVTLTNSGNATLDLSAVAFTGDFFAKSGIKGSCVSGGTVLAGKTCTVKVQFKPTQTGKRTGTLSFTDNALGSPQTVALTGTGK